MSCDDLTTNLTADEALAVLLPFYEAVQEKYLEQGLLLIRGTKLQCATWVHDSPRHFAACDENGKLIVVAPELAELSVDIVGAILAHELGHATDFLYPGEFVLGRDSEAVRRTRDDADDDQWYKWVRGWTKRDHDVVEKTADAIAELVMGVPIGYVGPCQLESFHGHQKRPVGLR